MMHLIGKYYMTADSNCYTVGEREETRSKRVLKARTRYYTSLARAVAETAEIVLRDKIASGEIVTLKAAVEELRSIKDAMQNMTKNEKAAFCDTILDYVFCNNVDDVPKSIEPYFILVRPYLDSEKKRIGKR